MHEKKSSLLPYEKYAHPLNYLCARVRVCVCVFGFCVCACTCAFVRTYKCVCFGVYIVLLILVVSPACAFKKGILQRPASSGRQVGLLDLSLSCRLCVCLPIFSFRRGAARRLCCTRECFWLLLTVRAQMMSSEWIFVRHDWISSVFLLPDADCARTCTTVRVRYCGVYDFSIR